ncbi:hypothetical protein KSS87_013044 [Heliosperma pusillum]|nr:hypothetical protein KSS87_013044 [Heliosperma pusillum]
MRMGDNYMNRVVVVVIGMLWVMMMMSKVKEVKGIGANWGTQASHPLDANIVVRMLSDNGIQKVKLFDADYDTLRAIGKTQIEVMVGIPNDMLYTLATSTKAADKWVSDNVTQHLNTNHVNIRYVAVGNEPYLATYNGSFLRTTFPALRNIQNALIKAGHSNSVKVTVPSNADVYLSASGKPSDGDFRADIHDYMIQIIKFLSDNGAPFTVNIYPFISLYTDANFPVEYAFFDGNAAPVNDGGTNYYNMFDANYDTLVWALQKNGFGNMPIKIGEIGWPTDGDINANPNYAQRFMQGFMSHIASGKGTPMRPSPIDAYLFSLIDEDQKSIQPGYFERHWGIFTFDGLAKYRLNLGTTTAGSLVPAKGVHYEDSQWCVLKPSVKMDDSRIANSVSYACSLGDCTSLGTGRSCQDLTAQENISYAFNSYYQINDQVDEACNFNGLATVTKSNPSKGTCRFIVMIIPSDSGTEITAQLPRMLSFLVSAIVLFQTML